MRPAARAALVLAVGVAGTSVAPAAAEHRLQLFAGTNDTGWIGLRVHGEAGVPVTLREQGGGPVAELTPEAADRTWIRVRGEEVGVRQSDGIHLSDRGAAIAASIVVRTLRRERIIR